jgi:hypothetical protein
MKQFSGVIFEKRPRGKPGICEYKLAARNIRQLASLSAILDLHLLLPAVPRAT